MFSLNQFNTMLGIQDELNSLIDPKWKEAKENHMLAAALECAEAIDHHGWKWWKEKPQPNVEQIQIELIDVLHFYLGQIIIDLIDFGGRVQPEDYIKNEVGLNAIKNDFDISDLDAITDLQVLEVLLATTVMKVPNLCFLIYTLNRFGLQVNEIIRLYVGKNVLNIFRQHNGYKDGSYIKIWSGKEDNEYLADIMKNVNLDDADLKDQIYQALTATYATYA